MSKTKYLIEMNHLSDAHHSNKDDSKRRDGNTSNVMVTHVNEAHLEALQLRDLLSGKQRKALCSLPLDWSFDFS